MRHKRTDLRRAASAHLGVKATASGRDIGELVTYPSGHLSSRGRAFGGEVGTGRVASSERRCYGVRLPRARRRPSRRSMAFHLLPTFANHTESPHHVRDSVGRGLLMRCERRMPDAAYKLLTPSLSTASSQGSGRQGRGSRHSGCALPRCRQAGAVGTMCDVAPATDECRGASPMYIRVGYRDCRVSGDQRSRLPDDR